MRLAYILFFVTSLGFIAACSSGKKAYEKGDYYAAVMKSVDRLRSRPTHKKSKETLKRSYPLAVSTLEGRANTAIATNAHFKYKEALNAYQQINNMYNEIRASPGALRVIPNPVNHFGKIAKLKQQAAEESYNIGVFNLNRNNREDAKKAYYNFKEAQSFVPNYKDTNDKIDEALFIATLKVVVDQLPVNNVYNLSASFFQDKVEEYLQTQFRSNVFVRFYTPQQVKLEKLPFVDQYIKLQFDDFVVGETHTERHTENISRDSVKTGTATLRDGTKVDTYGTVTAKLTINRKEVRSRGLLSMRITDANNNAVLTHRKFTGEFIWFSQWGNFNGDIRALTEEQLNICNSQEVPPPPPQNLFIEFTKPIYDQLIPSLNEFYRRY